MKNMLMMTLLVCVAMQIAPAQNRQDTKKERDEILIDLAAVRVDQKDPINSLLN